MSNLHRIIWLDRQLRNKRYPDRKKMADEFEISIRQAARDIEYMKYTMGAPVEYSAYHKGYYYTDDTYILPGQFMTEKEKKILNYLAFQYQNVGTVQASTLAELLQRITREKNLAACKKERQKLSLPIFNIKENEALFFKRLEQAIFKKRKVVMNYFDSLHQNTERVFCPYKLFNRDFRNYVVGYCELRKEIRVFRLDRIHDLRELKEKYSITSFFKEEDYDNNGSFNFREPYQALIFLEQKPGEFLQRYYLHELADNLYKIYFYNSTGLISTLLAEGHEFKVIKPDWLKEKIINRLHKIIKNFEV